MKDKVKQIISSWQFLIGIAVLVFSVLLIIMIRAAAKPVSITPNATPAVSNSQSQSSNIPASTGKKHSNPFTTFFSWILPSHTDNASTSVKNPSPPIASTQRQESSQTSSQIQVKPTAAATQLGQNSSSLQQHSQHSSSQTSGNSQDNSQSSSNDTNFQIVFQGPDGQTHVYTPNDSPSVQVTWATYTDPMDNYSVDYPSNWQLKKNFVDDHTSLSFFLPNGNINDPNQQYIGMGWSNHNLFPANDINAIQYAYASPAIVTGVDGTIYTSGIQGKSYIIAIFPYQNGYFGLVSTASDPSFAYVYMHMLQSLQFNGQ